jgi:hypothetical protein
MRAHVHLSLHPCFIPSSVFYPPIRTRAVRIRAIRIRVLSLPNRCNSGVDRCGSLSLLQCICHHAPSRVLEHGFIMLYSRFLLPILVKIQAKWIRRFEVAT